MLPSPTPSPRPGNDPPLGNAEGVEQAPPGDSAGIRSDLPGCEAGDASPCVLIVEDEPLTRRMTKASLQKNGFRVIEAESGEEALFHFEQAPYPDVVILDIGLPGLDGFEVCRKVRELRGDTAILMLTARADSEDKITGLTLGADDYLVKPFVPGELVARIRAVLRRATMWPAPTETLVFKDLTLDFNTQKAFKNGTDVNLSPREFLLLAALLRHPGKIMSRDQLGREVWGEARTGSARALDVFICKLREKIEEDPTCPRSIKTVRGAGYVFD